MDRSCAAGWGLHGESEGDPCPARDWHRFTEVKANCCRRLCRASFNVVQLICSMDRPLPRPSYTIGLRAEADRTGIGVYCRLYQSLAAWKDAEGTRKERKACIQRQRHRLGHTECGATSVTSAITRSSSLGRSSMSGCFPATSADADAGNAT